jgi:hypothetical protein
MVLREIGWAWIRDLMSLEASAAAGNFTHAAKAPTTEIEGLGPYLDEPSMDFMRRLEERRSGATQSQALSLTCSGINLCMQI